MMNWTGGNLQRFSRPGNSISQKQRQYFAKVRASQLLSSEPFIPSFLATTATANNESVRPPRHPSAGSGPSIPAVESRNTTFHVDSERKQLLQQADWVELGPTRPVQYKAHSEHSNKRFARRRKNSNVARRKLCQTGRHGDTCNELRPTYGGDIIRRDLGQFAEEVRVRLGSEALASQSVHDRHMNGKSDAGDCQHLTETIHEHPAADVPEVDEAHIFEESREQRWSSRAPPRNSSHPDSMLFDAEPAMVIDISRNHVPPDLEMEGPSPRLHPLEASLSQRSTSRICDSANDINSSPPQYVPGIDTLPNASSLGSQQHMPLTPERHFRQFFESCAPHDQSIPLQLRPIPLRAEVLQSLQQEHQEDVTPPLSHNLDAGWNEVLSFHSRPSSRTTQTGYLGIPGRNFSDEPSRVSPGPYPPSTGYAPVQPHPNATSDEHGAQVLGKSPNQSALPEFRASNETAGSLKPTTGNTDELWKQFVFGDLESDDNPGGMCSRRPWTNTDNGDAHGGDHLFPPTQQAEKYAVHTGQNRSEADEDLMHQSELSSSTLYLNTRTRNSTSLLRRSERDMGMQTTSTSGTDLTRVVGQRHVEPQASSIPRMEHQFFRPPKFLRSTATIKRT